MENNQTTNNLYETLGIRKSATAEEIKKVTQKVDKGNDSLDDLSKKSRLIEN